MALFQDYVRNQDKFKLKNVLVGAHPKLMDPSGFVVVAFVLPEGKSVKNSKLAKRMLLELHTRAGFPRQGLVTKLTALEGPALQRTFRDNFALHRELGLEYLAEGATVEFYGRPVLPEGDTLPAADFFLYGF